MAAAGAGVDHRRPYRGIRRSRFRGDRFHRAHAYPGSVPGGPDFLTDGTRVGRTDGFQRACFPAGVRLADRIIVPGHISAGERVCVPIGAFIPVADRIGIPEPVRIPDPVSVVLGLGEHVPVVSYVVVPARIHDEHLTVRIGIGFYEAGADAGSASRGRMPGLLMS